MTGPAGLRVAHDHRRSPCDDQHGSLDPKASAASVRGTSCPAGSAWEVVREVGTGYRGASGERLFGVDHRSKGDPVAGWPTGRAEMPGPERAPDVR